MCLTLKVHVQPGKTESDLVMVQPVKTDDELAKREALLEALTTFYSVVRKTQRSSAPEASELLNSAGKLSMEHIIPIYRVSSLNSTFTALPPA